MTYSKKIKEAIKTTKKKKRAKELVEFCWARALHASTEKVAQKGAELLGLKFYFNRDWAEWKSRSLEI